MLLHKRSLQHLLTRAAGALAKSRLWCVKQAFIHLFKRYYRVDLSDALEGNPNHYASFHDFFTRALKPGARPLPTEPRAIASPADGTVVTRGAVTENALYAKGHHYSLSALLGDKTSSQPFENKHFLTIYLAPKDYHRVHMPISGRLTRMRYIPGNLYPVNQQACDSIEGLFATNERVICHFDTDNGPMAMVLVGAMIVGSIVTPWHGPVHGTPAHTITDWTYPDRPLLKQGDEMGYFTLGSTVIVLWSNDQIDWLPSPALNTPVQQGQMLGSMPPPAAPEVA